MVLLCFAIMYFSKVYRQAYLLNQMDLFKIWDMHSKRLCWEQIFPWTLLLLNMPCPVLANSVDPDQLASEEANWFGSALFAIMWIHINKLEQVKIRNGCGFLIYLAWQGLWIVPIFER